tara:strand:- start:583 stop:828 length:246 start_codon:yes stop_codon:yes gene_type:complete
MILVGVSVRGYSDITMYGPFQSVDEARRKITDGVDRGNDGDETQYTFFKVTPKGVIDIGYVRFEDEAESDGDLRSESFYER